MYDLLQQNYRILRKPYLTCVNVNMRRQPRLPYPRRDRRCNHRGTVSVSNVVLYDQNRPQSSLLRAHHRAEIGVKYITASDGIHALASLPFLRPPLFPSAGVCSYSSHQITALKHLAVTCMLEYFSALASAIRILSSPLFCDFYPICAKYS